MVDLNVVTTYISPIIVIVCLALGYVIKYAIPSKIINSFIPLIVMVVGIGSNIWNVGAVSLEIVVTGAISGLAATGLYEAFSNILNLPKKIEEETVTIEYGQNSLKGKHFAK